MTAFDTVRLPTYVFFKAGHFPSWFKNEDHGHGNGTLQFRLSIGFGGEWT